MANLGNQGELTHYWSSLNSDKTWKKGIEKRRPHCQCSSRGCGTDAKSIAWSCTKDTIIKEEVKVKFLLIKRINEQIVAKPTATEEESMEEESKEVQE